ncbi:unnamed protein product [Litomosoides sigmodontis]|uniref:Olfactomedin-like domain-containing protein n=1 Tax=Litomosoides sigmodontis TaxID=42156 RepID=A0A3P6SUE6_LITSI|nr:unnamed protein product [Litomosoides sigmodontis]
MEVKRSSEGIQSHLSSLSVESDDQWTVNVRQNVTKTVVNESCKRIHRHCAKTGRKLMGFQGPHGSRGAHGPTGPPGTIGWQGKVGLTGLVGGIGAEGKPGIDGRCNCPFMDLYLQQITVPEPPPPPPPPPVTQIEEMTIPVTKVIPFKPTPPPPPPPLSFTSSSTTPLKKTDLLVEHTSITAAKTAPKILLPSEPTSSSLPFQEDYATMEANFTQYVPTLGYNKRVCLLNAVGIPVLHAESQYSAVGSWMRDHHPSNHEMAERRWVTDGYASPVLYEYENERQLMNKKQKIKYYIDYLASGTDSTDEAQVDLGDVSYLDCSRKRDHTFENCNETERDVWLYNRPHNYVDYSADENGLWVAYVRSGMQHVTVSKIEPDMHVVRTWDIYELNATDVAETFVMCGILYGLRNATDRDTTIHFAYDLFRNETIDVSVKWYNPYGGVTMLHYNPVDGRLYFFDSKRLLSVNVRVEGQVDQLEFPDIY